MREWLSGGVSPCQGEGRGFESRLALFKPLMFKGFFVVCNCHLSCLCCLFCFHIKNTWQDIMVKFKISIGISGKICWFFEGQQIRTMETLLFCVIFWESISWGYGMNEFAWNTWSQEQAIRYFLSNYLNQSEKGGQWIQSILADTGSYFDADRC